MTSASNCRAFCDAANVVDSGNLYYEIVSYNSALLTCACYRSGTCASTTYVSTHGSNIYLMPPSLAPTMQPSSVPTSRPTISAMPTIKHTFVPTSSPSLSINQFQSLLRIGHPRIIVTPSDWTRIQSISNLNAQTSSWTASLRNQAKSLLSTSVLTYSLSSGISPQLLATSETALSRISALALMYRLDNNITFAARGRAELLAICNFSDWQPSNYLSTAPMITAAAIGYDWLYDYLTVSDRLIVKTAIRTKGLDPGLNIFLHNNVYNFPSYQSNWNIVCNSGIIVGALAIAEDDYAYAARLIDLATRNIKAVGLPLYNNDGAWHESPDYWSFATNYAVQAIAALETAIGNDLGLSNVTAGLAKTGFFRIYNKLPDGIFNFGDSTHTSITYIDRAPVLFWLGTKYSQPLFSLAERTCPSGDVSALDLIWYSDAPADFSTLPLNALFVDSGFAYMRNTWSGNNIAAVAFKGGNANAGHGHHDTGSFVYYAKGVRWSWDLGSDSYNVAGYFSSTRYSDYRASSYSHSKVMLYGINESTNAFASIMKQGSTNQKSWTSMNLTSMWPGTNYVYRGIVLSYDGSIIIQDEISSPVPVTVVWSMQTLADLVLSKQLNMKGVKMNFTVIEPAYAIVDMINTPSDPAPAVSNAGFHTLRVRFPQPVKNIRIVVMITSNPVPLSSSDPMMNITNIATWKNGGAPITVPTMSPNQVPTTWPTKYSNSTGIE